MVIETEGGVLDTIRGSGRVLRDCQGGFRGYGKCLWYCRDGIRGYGTREGLSGGMRGYKRLQEGS